MDWVCSDCKETDEKEIHVWTLTLDGSHLCLGCSRVRRGLPREFPPKEEKKPAKRTLFDTPEEE